METFENFRDRYAALYEFAPVGYVTLDNEGKILETNSTTARMLGVNKEFVVGAKLSQFLTRESQDSWPDHMRAAFSGEMEPICEVEIQRRDGTHLAVRLEGILSGSGDDRRCMTALIDIIDLKKAERDLRDLGETLEQRVKEQTKQIRLQAEAISRLGEGVLITEGDHWLESRILFVNDAFCQITGYEAVDLIGRPRHVLLGGVDRETVGTIERELNAGKPCHAELLTRRKDETPYDIDLSITPLLDAGGFCTHFVSIHRDITARKLMDRQLEQYKKDLRRISSELMLAEERERQVLAQDLHDSLGQALFQARLMLDAASKKLPELKEVAGILEGVGKTVNILAFELSPPILRQLGVKAAIRWLAKDMGIRFGLSVSVNDDGRTVALDERVGVVLFRSVRELLINVAKHGRTKSAHVTVTASDQNLQVVVEDQGKGFDLAHQPLHVEKGHFGLFSVRERLEYLHGTLNIQSAPGAGTRVTVNVPILGSFQQHL